MFQLPIQVDQLQVGGLEQQRLVRLITIIAPGETSLRIPTTVTRGITRVQVRVGHPGKATRAVRGGIPIRADQAQEVMMPVEAAQVAVHLLAAAGADPAVQVPDHQDAVTKHQYNLKRKENEEICLHSYPYVLWNRS